MRSPTKSHCLAALWCALAMTVTGCSRPDPNAPIRITGDRTAAVPTTSATTTTSTTIATTTTYFYGAGGPGSSSPGI